MRIVSQKIKAEITFVRSHLALLMRIFSLIFLMESFWILFIFSPFAFCCVWIAPHQGTSAPYPSFVFFLILYTFWDNVHYLNKCSISWSESTSIEWILQTTSAPSLEVSHCLLCPPFKQQVPPLLKWSIVYWVRPSNIWVYPLWFPSPDRSIGIRACALGNFL